LRIGFPRRLLRALFDRNQQLVESVVEELDRVIGQLVGDGFHHDFGLGEVGHCFGGARNVFR